MKSKIRNWLVVAIMLVMVFSANNLFANAAVSFVIKNKATVTIENSTKETNEVENPVKELLPNSIIKKIIDADGKEVDSMEIDNINTELTFKGTIQITDDEDIDSVILKDVLNNSFDFVSMKVLDSDGKDITTKGKEVVKEKEVSFEFNTDYVQSLKGKKIEWLIKIKYNPSVPIEKEEDQEFISLPNVMELIVNGKPVVSPPVEVLVPPIEATITQRVLKATGEEDIDDVFTDNQRDIIFRGTSVVTNATQLENVSVDEEIYKALSYKSMKVFSADGKDITDKGKISTEGQNLEFKFDQDYVSTMYGKTFVWEVTTNYVEGSDLSNLVDGKIPNIMNLRVNDEVTSSDLSMESNIVTVSPIPLENTIVKSIINDSGEHVEELELIDVTKDILFNGDVQIANDTAVKNVVLTDMLHEAFSFKELSVFDQNGKDITNEGVVKVNGEVISNSEEPMPNDNEKEPTNEESESTVEKTDEKAPGDYASNEVTFEFTEDYAPQLIGQKLNWQIKANYIEGSDLSALEALRIPNNMKLTVNEATIDSNIVHVTPPALESNIMKKIVDGDKLVDSKEIVSVKDPIEFVVYAAIQNDEKLKSVVIQDVLDDRLEFNSLKVEDSNGQDVSNWGQVQVEKQVVSFKFNDERLEDLHGKTFKLTISTKIKESVTPEELKPPIDNIAFLLINDKKMESNKVTVIPNIPEEILPQTGERNLLTGVIGISVAIAGTAGFILWMKKRKKAKKETT